MESSRIEVPTERFLVFWMVISAIFSLFVVCQISGVEVPLPDVEISATGNLTTETCGSASDCVGEFQAKKTAIDTSHLGVQLEGFDNFFPISAISTFKLTLTVQPKANASIKVTNPAFSDKVNIVNVFCGNNETPRFATKTPRVSAGTVRPVEVGDAISKLFDCQNPSFQIAYEPTQKEVEVGPNELVSLVLDDDQLIITLPSILTAEPSRFTKGLVFFIVFFISLGAGSILFFYLQGIGIVRSKTIAGGS